MKADAKKKIVFIAGSPSHGYAQHEHHAGCLLLAKCIQENVPEAETVVYQGWPKDPHALDDAATRGHLLRRRRRPPVMSHLDEFDKLATQGRRPGLHPLCGRGAQGQGGRPDEELDRRLFRDLLVGQSGLDGPLREVPRPSRGPRRPPLHDQRRVVLSHAFSRTT